ncbi:hypothetical protein OA84_09570 [Kaistella solincola]|uniref:Secreted protein n=1 Tax=Kaistella solincola TaxID=510955 RepID=A0ABR4ZQV1_9FLAO|nr:hypothetical protein OA84_09570 [Kaistella solincola]
MEMCRFTNCVVFILLLLDFYKIKVCKNTNIWATLQLINVAKFNLLKVLFGTVLNNFYFCGMNIQIIPFKVAPLAPAQSFKEEMLCGKKNCCKKFKKGKRCKKCPGRLKLA